MRGNLRDLWEKQLCDRVRHRVIHALLPVGRRIRQRETDATSGCRPDMSGGASTGSCRRAAPRRITPPGHAFGSYSGTVMGRGGRAAGGVIPSGGRCREQWLEGDASFGRWPDPCQVPVRWRRGWRRPDADRGPVGITCPMAALCPTLRAGHGSRNALPPWCGAAAASRQESASRGGAGMGLKPGADAGSRISGKVVHGVWNGMSGGGTFNHGCCGVLDISSHCRVHLRNRRPVPAPDPVTSWKQRVTAATDRRGRPR